MYNIKISPKLKSDDRSIMNQILKEEAFFLNQKQGDIHSFVLDDDQDQLLNKLLNVHKMTNIDKENYTKHISYCVRNLGQKSTDKLPMIMEKYKNEDERFQIMFIEQLNLIYEASLQAQQPVIQILSFFLLNSILKIKELAGSQLTKIALHLQGDEKGNQLLPIIIKMAHDDLNQDNRIVALQLMGKLSSMFGIQLSESFIAFEVMSLGEDSKQDVRKEAVNQLPLVAKVVGKDFFNKKLFPFYMKRCKETNTKVKTACVEHFLQIVELSSQNQKTADLTAQLLQFQNDSNKYVKGVAYRCLARFIAAIEKDKIEPRLIENYLKMADSDIRELLPEQQVMFACAYGFPAVLQTVGVARWQQLHKLFNHLWKQKNERICKTLAASLHEIAKIIGAEKAEIDLFPVLETIFVKEPNDNVLMGCVKNLSQFLKIFSDEKKEAFLEIFFFIQRDLKKWRIRESIANQLDEMALIFPAEIIFRMILPIAFKLCTDNVAQVRKIASSKIYAFFQGIKDSPLSEQYQTFIIESMIGFQKSSVFYQRQSFIQMCSKIMQFEDAIFQQHLLRPLLELAQDKVQSVRYMLYMALENYLKIQGRQQENPQLLEVFNQLSNDKTIKSLVKYKPTLEVQAKEPESKQQENLLPNSEMISQEPQLEEIDDDEIPQRIVQEEPDILKQLRQEKQEFIKKQEEIQKEQLEKESDEKLIEQVSQITINENTEANEFNDQPTQSVDDSSDQSIKNNESQELQQFEQLQGQGEQQQKENDGLQQNEEYEQGSQNDQKEINTEEDASQL
ncbi:unnamed protein product (macronuclear) [Paramecium tetraurelia]|uniref:TOG domain-containing protein n=1 Tax=Paramecium tetraurelia TaxID=5888 RepID=A0E850_PARTE|nr:uncharacterized protein GSPATT00024195001 [Paramecium tetraurelia]CAK91467.1 unnamed protein product [Paramecium tetraurelia]|eukprot:XP_001458864.1 hypothetical protein (macronuclear) [Paramecium tetraurelia strain d4-2]